MTNTRPKPPRGFQAILWRLPIWLYRFNLGWLLGERLLLLNHIGRKSGAERQAVLEVVRHDTAEDAYYVCSGFGKLSHWYQNLEAEPDVTIQVGGRKLAVHANLLAPSACGDEMVRYVQQHPKLAQNLIQIIGYDPPQTIEEYRTLAEKSLPFVKFTPR